MPAMWQIAGASAGLLGWRARAAKLFLADAQTGFADVLGSRRRMSLVMSCGFRARPLPPSTDTEAGVNGCPWPTPQTPQEGRSQWCLAGYPHHSSPFPQCEASTILFFLIFEVITRCKEKIPFLA